MIFDNADFYPTPNEVLDQMCFNIDLKNKVILEPSSGNGSIIDHLRQFSPKEILCCENNPDLAKISAQKADRFLNEDFLQVTKEEVSHLDLIIMNPPFSADETHILHAWEILPEGGQIIALCNYNTYEFARTRERRVFRSTILENGKIENIGKAFSNAERKTDVSIGLIYLNKPKSASEDEFEGYFDLHEEHEIQSEGIMTFNSIRDVVNRYVGAVKMFDEVQATSKQMNDLIEPINNNTVVFGATWGSNGQNKFSSVTRDSFKKELQKSAWKSLFDRMNMKKYVTSSVISDINKFAEKQSHIPFTMKNVYKMFEIIVGTRENTMKKVIVEVFDNLTKHHHENRFSLEGWKTNSEYRVNKKFIINWGIINKEWGGKMDSYWKESYIIDDLTKALCYITGENYNTKKGWHNFIQNVQPVKEKREYKDDNGKIVEYESNNTKAQYREFGTWYDFNYFEIKGFKKGTVHVKFKEDKIWEMFNKVACEAKGFMLASKYTSDFRKKEKGVEIYQN